MTQYIELGNTKEPAWSSKIERWYQLDEVSYSFCEGIHQWDYLQKFEKPKVIILALEGASNLSDFDFVHGGGVSPAKFVYTLPNVCISVIFQILNYNGKVYCFNKGEKTLEFATNEAHQMAQTGRPVWVFSSSPILEKNRRRVSFELINYNLLKIKSHTNCR